MGQRKYTAEMERNGEQVLACVQERTGKRESMRRCWQAYTQAYAIVNETPKPSDLQASVLQIESKFISTLQ